jgi:hypothetical protein
MIAASCIERYPLDAVGKEYERALKRTFTPRLRGALAAMLFVRTPAFSALTALTSIRPVEKAIAYALAHV